MTIKTFTTTTIGAAAAAVVEKARTEMEARRQIITSEANEPRETQTAARLLAPVRDENRSLVAQALRSGVPADVLKELICLQERVEQNDARRAFDAAMSDAKGNIGPILKNREVDFTSAKGRTNYRHEDFAQVARTVDPILREHGLSYRFRSAQEGQRVRVTCILSHRDGHSEETTLEAAEDHSGNKNTIQAVGSAATYLQRYTLKLALGLSSSTDDDGAAVGAGDKITPEQAAEIERGLADTKTNLHKFLAIFKAEIVADLAAKDLPRAMQIIGERRAAQSQKEAAR